MGALWTSPWARRRLPEVKVFAASAGGPFTASITSNDGRYNHFRDRATASAPMTAALRLLALVGVRCLCGRRAARVGPYRLCLNLACGVLVVATIPAQQPKGAAA